MFDEMFENFEEDNEPFTDEMYDEVEQIEAADELVEQFLRTTEGIAFKNKIAKELGETKFERINLPITRGIKVAMRELVQFVSNLDTEDA